VKLGSLDRAGFLRLIFRLQGDGLTQDEDSNLYKERDAWAYIAASVSETLESAASNLLLSTAVTLLDKYEATRHLLQGSTRLTSSRQSRLVAFLRSLPMVPARIDRGFSGHVGATTGTTLRPTLAQLQAHRASPLGALFVARREPAAADPLVRRDLVPMLERGLPARAIPGMVSTRDALWGDAVDPAGIKMAPIVTVPAQTKARTAWPEVYPGSVITREAWIELQSQLCWKSHGFSIDQHAQGRTIFVSAAIGSGGTSIDTTIDWSNRIVQAWGVVSGSSITDPTTLDNTSHSWLPPSKMGPAGSGYTHTMSDTQVSPASVGITFSVNGSGNLVITNTSGGTRHVRLLVRSTPEYTPGSSADTQPWIDADQMEHADMSELYASTVVSDVDDAGQFAGVNAGALRRICYSGPLTRTAGQGVPQGVVLDTSEDWRNRWVLVVPMQTFTGATDSATNNIPVIGAWGMRPKSAAKRTDAPRLFFTGAGQSMGSPTVLANQHPCAGFDAVNDPVNTWLFARDDDGALCLEMKAGLSNNQTYTGLLMVLATEQTTGDSVVTPVPVHASQVQTLDLEQPLNCGVYAQGRQGNVPRYLLTDDAPKARPTCPPMGLQSEGHSPVRPAKYELRERLGALDDGTWERRQELVKQRKRLVTLHVPTGQTLPIDAFNVPAEMGPGQNDQLDFRDRFVWAEGRYAASDITVSDPTQASDASATGFAVIMYTGPGASIETELAVSAGVFLKYEHTRAYAGGGYHSRLLIRNVSGSDVYLNATVECSGFLGFTDRRAIGA
jgi:hypothetical protein